QDEQERRRRIDPPSSDGRESFTCVSSWPQKGQCIYMFLYIGFTTIIADGHHGYNIALLIFKFRHGAAGTVFKQFRKNFGHRAEIAFRRLGMASKKSDYIGVADAHYTALASP